VTTHKPVTGDETGSKIKEDESIARESDDKSRQNVTLTRVVVIPASCWLAIASNYLTAFMWPVFQFFIGDLTWNVESTV
jgi:hypothetical protein